MGQHSSFLSWFQFPLLCQYYFLIYCLITFLAHDCELNFVDISKAALKVKEKPDKVFYKGNPFLTGVFTNNTTFIACGYDKVPFLFKKGSKGSWEFEKILDDGITKEKEAQIGKGSFEASLNIYKKQETQKGSS